MRFTLPDAEALITALNDGDADFIVSHGQQTIYGTGTAQKVYLRVQEYLKLTKPNKRNAGALLANVEQKHIEKEKYPEISNYWLSVKNLYIETSPIPTKTPDNQARAEFWGDFDAVYANQGRDPRTMPLVIKGPEIRAPGGQNFVPRDNAALIDDIIVRRSCKFLLYNAIGRSQDIAYVLDDLDLDTVAQRLKVEETTDRLGPGTTERKLPVCTSELLEIFRRWDFFQNHVTFYNQWKICDPPWFTHGRQHWATHASRLATKITNKYPQEAGLVHQQGRVAARLAAGDHLQAILKYHEMRPSRFLPGTFVRLASAY